MRRFVPLLAAACLALLAFAASASGAARLYAPAYGSSGGEPERISAFERADNGALAPIAGSPFAAYPGPPFGVGGVIGIAFAPDGARAATGFLVPGGGVQGYSVSAAGVPTATTVAPANQTENIAVSPNGNFVYSATREYPPGSGTQGIRAFGLTSVGQVSPLATTSFDGATSFCCELAITPDGRFLYATTGGALKPFAINGDGSLTPLGTYLATASLMLPSPDGRFLFAYDYNAGAIVSSAIGADGSLTANGESAATASKSVNLMSISPDGRFIYVADEGANQIDVIAVAADGTVSFGGSMPAANPEATAVSPDGRFLYWNGGEDAIHTAAIGADGIPAPLPFTVPWETGEPVHLVFQPGPAPVAAFKAKAAAPGAATTFNAAASTNAAHYSWNFGDGATLAEGGPKPSHVYAKAGKYTVTLSVTDGQGCGAQQIYTGQSTTCPGGTATTTSAVVDTLPVVSKLKAQPKKFLPKGVGSKGKTGTSFRYALNEKAKVNLKIERKLPGRLVGRKCKKPTSANKGRKKCSRFVKAGSRKGTGKVGVNKVSFNGKLKGRPLLPGAYRVTAVATDSAGGRSAPKTAAFRVLPY